jgi:hypothetical protein
MGRIQPDRALIEELSQQVISEVAPEELDIFDDLSAEYFADPTPPDLNAQESDDALGFGLNEVLIAATPAANAMIGIVLAFAIQTVIQAAGDETSDFVRGRIKALFGKGAKQEAPRFSQDQLRHMRQIAEAEAKRFGLDDQAAAAMADSLFRRMVLGE